ncbi:MAG: hypothetical protein MZV63_02870 [Marinilabiliales bacterium]|nr:hypothetical protein [Marinilabiliales bacterium]
MNPITVWAILRRPAIDWELFRQMPAARSLPEYELIDYNLGYVWLQ